MVQYLHVITIKWMMCVQEKIELRVNSHWMRRGAARHLASRHLASRHFPFCLIHIESVTTHAFCKKSKNGLHFEDVHIALALQNVWLKAEGSLSNYNYHADFSMGRQDMFLRAVNYRICKGRGMY